MIQKEITCPKCKVKIDISQMEDAILKIGTENIARNLLQNAHNKDIVQLTTKSMRDKS